MTCLLLAGPLIPRAPCQDSAERKVYHPAIVQKEQVLPTKAAGSRRRPRKTDSVGGLLPGYRARGRLERHPRQPWQREGNGLLPKDVHLRLDDSTDSK